MDCGDRLGHAIALGIDVEDWYRSKSYNITVVDEARSQKAVHIRYDCSESLYRDSVLPACSRAGNILGIN